MAYRRKVSSLNRKYSLQLDTHSTPRLFLYKLCFNLTNSAYLFGAWVVGKKSGAITWRLKAHITGQLDFSDSFLTSSSQCVGCHRHLRATEDGVQVRIRDRKPYCKPCYFQLKCEYWPVWDNDLWMADPLRRGLIPRCLMLLYRVLFLNWADVFFFTLYSLFKTMFFNPDYFCSGSFACLMLSLTFQPAVPSPCDQLATLQITEWRAIHVW